MIAALSTLTLLGADDFMVLCNTNDFPPEIGTNN